MSLKGSRSVKYTVLSVTNVLRSFSIVLDKCQPLLSGKHHCAGLNSSLSVSLSSIRMMYVFLAWAQLLLDCHILLSSLSISCTNFVLPLLLPSLSVTRLPPSRSLYICFVSRFFVFSLLSIHQRVHLFVMLLGPSTYIFYQFIFSHLCFHLVPLLINVLSDNGSI